MKKTLKRLLALVLVFCMSTIAFGYTVDEIMGDKYPFKDYIDGTNHFSASPFQSHHDTQVKYDAYDCVAGNSSVNDYTIEFGNYPQDGISDMAKQPIKWLVLEKVNGMALLMSLDILDSKQMFNMTLEEGKSKDLSDETVWTYENSDLRKWLNEEFYNKAFNSTEKEYIVQYDATSDKVFVPTTAELKSYFRLDKQDFEWDADYSNVFNIKYNHKGNPWSITKATAYAKNSKDSIIDTKFGGKSVFKTGYNEFWTRTYGGKNKNGRVVYSIGYDGGGRVNGIAIHDTQTTSQTIFSIEGVRPCIWISFDPGVRSAKWQEWDSLGGKIASGLVGSALDMAIPGIGILLP